MSEDTQVEASGRAGRVSSTMKLIIFIVMVLGVFAVFRWTSAGEYFTREYIEGLLAGLGVWAPAGFVLIYAVATVVGVPGTILTVLGGIIFGAYLGTALIVTGATIGASGAFFVARFLARDFVGAMFGKAKWFRKLDDGIKEQGVYFILFIRLVPVFPFNGINFASGLTQVRFRDYFIGTAIGIIPASFVFANAASKAAQAVAGGGVGAGFYISLALLGALAIAPVVYKKMKSKGGL